MSNFALELRCAGSNFSRRWGRVIGVTLALLGAVGLAQAQSPSAEPLLQQSDISFVGAFALDPGNFSYGAYSLTYWVDASGRQTLFANGNNQTFALLGQIQIPPDSQLMPASTSWNSLTVATTLQSVHKVVTGGLCSPDANPDWMYGGLVYGTRLILGASNSYCSNPTGALAVWDQPSNLAASVSTSFRGWYNVNATAVPRAIGGYFLLIPAEWQPAFGGPVLVGNCCESIIGATSSGIAATVIDPSNVGITNPIPGTTVLYYPLTNQECATLGHTGYDGCDSTQQGIFNLTTKVLGGAFVPGTRTVFFVEGHGIGPYCYDTAAACGDPVMTDVKGPHAQPYVYQIVAYDANDLVAAKNGKKNVYDLRPYNANNACAANNQCGWILPELTGGGSGNDPRGYGAAYDPTTNRLYVRGVDGTQPEIFVYQITVPHSSVLLPPSGLRVSPTP